MTHQERRLLCLLARKIAGLEADSKDADRISKLVTEIQKQAIPRENAKARAKSKRDAEAREIINQWRSAL